MCLLRRVKCLSQISKSLFPDDKKLPDASLQTMKDIANRAEEGFALEVQVDCGHVHLSLEGPDARFHGFDVALNPVQFGFD